jgi:NodT family efflux transporter outer membrane factor (OMF) lipoprotein
MKKAWISLLFLAGCKGGYHAPDSELPHSFINSEACTFNEKAFNPRFWEQLNDPLINYLAHLVEEKNFDLLTAQSKIQELRAQYRFQTSQLFPQISGTGAIRRERDTQTLTFSRFTGFVFQTFYETGFDTTWEIDLFGVQKAAKQSAFFSMMSQVEQTAYLKLTVVSEVVLQYVNLRTMQSLNHIYEKELDVLSEITALSQDRFISGLNNQITDLTNKARIEDKKALIGKIQGDIDKLIYLVTQLTGQFPDSEYQLLKTYERLKADISLIYNDIPSNIILNRPDVSSARFKLFSQQALLKKAYRDFFPQFNITNAYGVLSNFPNLTFKKPSLQWDIMPGFNVTLIDFGALVAQKNVAKAQEKEALFSYEGSLVNAFTEVETALSQAKAADDQIGFLEKELSVLKQRTADYKERFRAGLIEKTSYLEAYLEQLIIEESLIHAINSRYGFAISFYKALGVRL